MGLNVQFENTPVFDHDREQVYPVIAKYIDKCGRRSDLNVNFPYTPMLNIQSSTKRVKIGEPQK